MNYLLLLLVILVFSVQTLCFKLFSRTYMKNLASYMAFNSLYYAVIVAALAVSGVQLHGLHGLTAVLAVAFGIVFVASIFLYMKAMEHGPLSLSSLAFSFGLLVPILFGAAFWNEGISLLQGIALLLLLFTFWLGGNTAQDQSRRINLKWLLFGLGAMLGNGALMTLSKAQQMSLPGVEVREFLLIAFGTAALLSLAIFLIRRFRAGERVPQLKGRGFVLLVLATGITTAVGNLVGLFLSGRLPAVVQFPVTNGGIVFLSSLLSMALLKERMSRNGWIGLALGLVALVLISL